MGQTSVSRRVLVRPSEDEGISKSVNQRVRAEASRRLAMFDLDDPGARLVWPEPAGHQSSTAVPDEERSSSRNRS